MGIEAGRSGGPSASTEDTVLEGRLIEDGGGARITVREGKVAEIVRLDHVPIEDYVAPGWMDIQVNGFAGHDPNDGDADSGVVVDMVHALWRTGVAAMCPTICTSSEPRMISALSAIALACDTDPLVAASIVGIHVEGPHISPENGPRGAHPPEHIRPPDIAEYRRWQEAAGGRIRIITLSPEYEQAVPYIRAITGDGVVASIGHTGASGVQIRAAVDAGASWSTHLGNGSHAMIPRHANYLWDQLAEDRLSAGFIFDGQHLPPALMRTMIRAKGVERSILVSDAVAVAGSVPGVYQLPDGIRVELLPSGRLTLQGTPYLAGAVAGLAVGVANAVRYTGVTLAEAVRMVTANPSRLLGFAAKRGFESVRVGAAANLTVFRVDHGTGELEVRQTIVAGRTVHTNQGEGADSNSR